MDSNPDLPLTSCEFPGKSVPVFRPLFSHLSNKNAGLSLLGKDQLRQEPRGRRTVRLGSARGVGAAAGGDYWGAWRAPGRTGRTPRSPGARDSQFPEGLAASPGRLLPGSARPPLLSRAAPAHLAQTCPPAPRPHLAPHPGVTARGGPRLLHCPTGTRPARGRLELQFKYLSRRPAPPRPPLGQAAGS